jgi:hypothetical protein
MDKAVQLARGDRLYEIMQIWDEGVNLSKRGFLHMGRAVNVIKKEKLWRYDAEHMPSFKYWCENVLHISVSQAHRLAQIDTEVGHILSTDIDIEISKVTLLLPYLEGQTDEVKTAMLQEAALLSVENIKNNLKSRTGNGTPTDECEHDETEQISRCVKCGKWLR